jgi:hypothetical protein
VLPVALSTSVAQRRQFRILPLNNQQFPRRISGFRVRISGILVWLLRLPASPFTRLTFDLPAWKATNSESEGIFMRLLSLATMLLGIAAFAGAQDAPKAASSGLKVSDVQEMVQGGLSEDLVITALRKENHPFELSGLQMVQLKKAGLSDNIIKVMLDPRAFISASAAPAITSGAVLGALSGAKPSGATPATGVSEQALAASANNPEAPHDSGIYLFTRDKNGQNVMVPLERASTEGTKTGVLGMALTYGIMKGKTKAIIPGPRASVRANESNPVFYFYFEDKSAALGKAHGFGTQTVSNPNQFSMLRFDQKKESREVVIGTVGFASASTGSESKERVAFKSERVSPGVYKVVPNLDMKVGEYAFVSASASGAAGAADIFDFAINDSR